MVCEKKKTILHFELKHFPDIFVQLIVFFSKIINSMIPT